MLNLENLRITKENFGIIISGVAKSNLISLNISSNDLTNEGANWLFKDHNDLKHKLTELKMSNVKITDKWSNELIDFIHDGKIQRLYISNNPGLKFDTINRIFGVLQRNQHLSHLDLQGTDMYTEYSIFYNSEVNKDFVKQNNILNHLNLSNWNFTIQTIRFLICTLKHYQIKHLNISGNHL